MAKTPKGYGGRPAYGNEYDLSTGCRRCGTGARRVSPLYLKASDLSGDASRNVVETGAGEILIHVTVADAFRAQAVTAELHEVRRHTDGRRLPWFHLSSQVTLPPRSARTEGGARENPCALCDRDGYFDSLASPLRLAYEREALPPEPLDVALTWEAYGNSWLEPPSVRHVEGPRFAQPLVLVSERVASMLRSLGVRHLTFDEVRVI